MAEAKTGPKLGFFGPMKTLDSAQYGFEELMFRDWILYSIEESGETEKFVPALFAHAHAEE